MDELFPVVSGVVLGTLVAGLRPSRRLWVGVVFTGTVEEANAWTVADLTVDDSRP